MKKIMRTDEQNKESGEKAKNTLFGRLAKRFENPGQQFKEREVKNPVQTENLIQKMSVVKDKEIAADRKPWLKKRGFLGHNEDIDFAKTIFRLLQQNGEVKSSALINLLATMGIPLPIFLIKQCLVCVFKPKNIDSYLISENSMMSLCKTDEFERNIMAVFVHSLVLLGKNSINSIDNPISNTNKVILSSHDIYALLKDWWHELDSMKAHQIHLNEVSEFLQKKSVVVDANEGRKFLAKFKFHGTFLDFNQFLLIFAKFIVKNSLRTLCFRLAEDYQSSDFFSNDYTLTLMRKKIVFAGIKYPVPEFSAEEGASAISNIKKITNCETFNDFDEYLAIWGKNLRQNKQNKDNNEEKKRELAVVHWETKHEDFEEAQNKKQAEEAIVFGIKDRCTILGNSYVHAQADSQWKHSIAPKFAPFMVQRL